MTTFASIHLQRWRQFERIEIDLTPRLCVLTGPNGCGKTTVLNVLGRHFGWNLTFLTASFLTKKEKRVYSDVRREANEGANDSTPIGSIGYSSGPLATIHAQPTANPQYNVSISPQQPVVGLHIPSHRPPPAYAQITQIPVAPKDAHQLFQEYQGFLFQTYGEQARHSPSKALKEALIGFAVFGEGNRSVRPNSEYVAILKTFEEVLERLLPEQIGFEGIRIDAPDVVLRTKSGVFPLEAMSGGINALFGIAWQIHMKGSTGDPCTVIIDEPENHLHPSMQRELLPRLLSAFPTHKFIVATHSPFVVSSTPDAAVYAMLFNDDRRVESRLLTESDLAASPNKVLREVLDVPMTMPLWVEKRLRSILAQFDGVTFDNVAIAKIRDELRKEGLEDAFGDFLAQPTPQEKMP